MNYSILKIPYTFARLDANVDNVGWLHGTNSSIKREYIEKVGGWDTTVKNQDEHSFAFKLKKKIKAEKSDKMLVFRSNPMLVRRLDIGGDGKEKTQLFKRI